MLLSEWRAAGTHPSAMTPKVDAAVEPVLRAMGAADDLEGGYHEVALLDLLPAGLVFVHVRVSAPQEGPRASGKLVRWNRVQVGDYSIETHDGHRLLSFQIENQVLHGVDDECDPLAAFIVRLLAAQDGRLTAAFG